MKKKLLLEIGTCLYNILTYTVYCFAITIFYAGVGVMLSLESTNDKITLLDLQSIFIEPPFFIVLLMLTISIVYIIWKHSFNIGTCNLLIRQLIYSVVSSVGILFILGNNMKDGNYAFAIFYLGVTSSILLVLLHIIEKRIRYSWKERNYYIEVIIEEQNNKRAEICRQQKEKSEGEDR